MSSHLILLPCKYSESHKKKSDNTRDERPRFHKLNTLEIDMEIAMPEAVSL